MVCKPGHGSTTASCPQTTGTPRRIGTAAGTTRGWGSASWKSTGTTLTSEGILGAICLCSVRSTRHDQKSGGNGAASPGRTTGLGTGCLARVSYMYAAMFRSRRSPPYEENGLLSRRRFVAAVARRIHAKAVSVLEAVGAQHVKSACFFFLGEGGSTMEHDSPLGLTATCTGQTQVSRLNRWVEDSITHDLQSTGKFTDRREGR